MLIEVEFWHLVTLLVSFISFSLAAGKILFAQIDKRLDERFAAIESVGRKAADDVEQLDADIKQLRVDLPMHYQRREDAIREYTVVLARVDAVGDRLEQSVRRDDYVRDVSVQHAKLDALVGRIDRLMEAHNL